MPTTAASALPTPFGDPVDPLSPTAPDSRPALVSPDTTSDVPAFEPADEAAAVAPATVPLVQLFETLETPLLHYAHGFVKRRAVAEDLVQEAFLRLHRQGDVVHHPRAWLYRCVRNLALNHRRDHERETVIALPDTAPGQAPTTAAPPPAPDQQLERADALHILREHLADLPPDDQRLLQLKYHEDETYQGIADSLDIGVGNVGYRLHHLLKSLARQLAHAGYPSRRASDATPPTA